MATINVDELKPNSNKYKRELEEMKNNKVEEKERAKPLIDEKQIVSTKKPLRKKILESLLPEDVKDVKSWLIYDVAIPGIKDLVFDSISMMFYGERNGGRGRRKKGAFERVSYNKFYDDGGSRRSSSSSRRRNSDSYDSDDKVDFRNIVLRNRGDADIILNEMGNRIDHYGQVSIADLLDMIGCTSKYTDNNYGWTDERDIGVRKVRDGWLIDVSEPRHLED